MQRCKKKRGNVQRWPSDPVPFPLGQASSWLEATIMIPRSHWTSCSKWPRWRLFKETKSISVWNKASYYYFVSGRRLDFWSVNAGEPARPCLPLCWVWEKQGCPCHWRAGSQWWGEIFTMIWFWFFGTLSSCLCQVQKGPFNETF